MNYHINWIAGFLPSTISKDNVLQNSNHWIFTGCIVRKTRSFCPGAMAPSKLHELEIGPTWFQRQYLLESCLNVLFKHSKKLQHLNWWCFFWIQRRCLVFSDFMFRWVETRCTGILFFIQQHPEPPPLHQPWTEPNRNGQTVEWSSSLMRR